jgi:aspartate-semialdehyde dehydrogenase
VPELSSTALLKSLNAVANPPVAAIQAALVLVPLQVEFGLKQVSLTVLQSASSLGRKGVEALRKQSGALLNGRPPESDTVIDDAPAQLALNLAPVSGGGDSYSSADEIRTTLLRILADSDIEVQVELVQAPVFYANGLSLACRLNAEVDEAQLRGVLQKQHGLELLSSAEFDTCGTCNATEYDAVAACVTQMRQNGHLNLWSVIDTLRKGSALNAVQIAELFVAKEAV